MVYSTERITDIFASYYRNEECAKSDEIIFNKLCAIVINMIVADRRG